MPSGTPFNVRIFVLILIELFATEVGMPGRDGGLLLLPAWFCWRFRPELTPEGGAGAGVAACWVFSGRTPWDPSLF